MTIALLKSWADAALRQRLVTLQAELDEAHRTIAANDVELGQLAAIIARDRSRIQAETAAYCRDRALAEGSTHEQRRQSAS